MLIDYDGNKLHFVDYQNALKLSGFNDFRRERLVYFVVIGVLDVFTEETLTEHEHQVATVKNYYEENKEMFKLVDKRENLWKKKLEFEVCC